MFDFWESDLTEEETEDLVVKAAKEIRRRGMVTPAVLALEMFRPLSFIGANQAMMHAPFLVPILGYDAVHDYSRLFKNRENVERLLQEIERQESEAKKEEAPCP